MEKKLESQLKPSEKKAKSLGTFLYLNLDKLNREMNILDESEKELKNLVDEYMKLKLKGRNSFIKIDSNNISQMLGDLSKEFEVDQVETSQKKPKTPIFLNGKKIKNP